MSDKKSEAPNVTGEHETAPPQSQKHPEKQEPVSDGDAIAEIGDATGSSA